MMMVSMILLLSLDSNWLLFHQPSCRDQRGSEAVRNEAEMEELCMKTFIIS